MGRPRKIENMFTRTAGTGQMSRPEGAGNFDNMDDVNIVEAMTLNIGTIQNSPTDNKDIVNKEYVDAQIAGENHWDDTGTTLEPFNAGRNILTTGNVQGVTPAEFDTLTDNSIADALHRHSELVASDGSPDPALSVDAAGNVGIGTTAPLSLLHANSADPVLLIKDTETSWTSANSRLRLAESGAAGILDHYWDVRMVGDAFMIENSDEGSNAFNIDRYGNIGIGTTAPAQRLVVAKSGTPTRYGYIGYNNADNDSVFGSTESIQYIADTGEAHKFMIGVSEKVRIDANGNMGIGTTSPDEKLDIGNGGKLTIHSTGDDKSVDIYHDDTDGHIDVLASGDLIVNCGTDKTIELTDSVWDDQQVDLANIRLGASAPTWTAYKGAQVLAFDKAQDNKIDFNLQLSHKYKLGSNIEFHIHNTPADDTAGDVRWVLTVSLSDINGDFPAESTFTAVQTINANEADKHLFFEIDDNIGSASGLSAVALISLTRTGTHVDDDYDNDMYLVALDAHIELDTIGSRTEATK